MEQTIQTEYKTQPIGGYFYSMDMIRVILILCLILARYGVPLVSGVVTPFLNFATGTLFLFYGYIVLRDGNDLRINIKHALKIFIIMFVVCFVFATAYMYLVYGTPFAYFTKRGIFNFVVLNYWGPSIGDYIWYVQSVLYSLVVCYLLRKFKRYDWIICIVLFVFAFLIGEGAGLIHFNILGYTYIPGNFLTRTLPYMLLGRILYRHSRKLRKKKYTSIYILLILVGFLICAAELIGFSALGILVYYGHLMGFIMISIGVAGLMISHNLFGEVFASIHPEFYKKMFFLFNPLGEILTLVFTAIVNTKEDYFLANSSVGVFVCALTILIALGWEAVEKSARERKMKKIAAMCNEEE